MYYKGIQSPNLLPRLFNLTACKGSFLLGKFKNLKILYKFKAENEANNSKNHSYNCSQSVQPCFNAFLAGKQLR